MLGSACVKTKWEWERFLAALGLCALFFLGTFSLYGLIPREHPSGLTAKPNDTVESVSVKREIVQTVPVDSPITGLTLFFSDAENHRSGNVYAAITGRESSQVFFEGAVSLAELSEEGEAALRFSQAAVAGQDSHLVVKVTTKDPQGFKILCSEGKTVRYGDLTVDGSSSEGSLVFRPSLYREYWSWRRAAPLPYAVLCLLLGKLTFWAKAWYEKKSGKTVAFPRNEKWWLQAVCGGFLLACGAVFARNAIYLGIVCSRPDCFSQIRRISAFSDAVTALMYLAVMGIITYIAVKTPPIERVAAVSVLTLGIFYMVAITPLSPPDEVYHYNSAYNLSNYLLFHWKNPEVGNSAHFDYRELSSHVNVPSAYLRVMTEWLLPGARGEEISVPYPRGLSYPIEYIPQGVGLAVGRMLNLNFLGIFYLGRLTNLFFFAVCVYFAVKRIPRFKGLMALTALMPMTLHQAASYSYDTFINGMALLFIAALIREYNGEGKMTRKDFLWLLIPGALLTPAKAVYSAMLLSALLIPARRFGGTKQKWGAIAGAFLICVGMLVAVNYSSLVYRIQSVSADIGDASQLTGAPLYSVGFILKHPVETARIFLTTLREQGEGWFRCVIGWRLSGLSLGVSMEYITAFTVGLLLSVAVRESGMQKVTMGQRAVFLLCAGLVVLLSMLGMFTGWTPMGSPVVEGIQGRYFIPIFPLLFLAISGNWEVKQFRLDSGLLAAACFVNTLVVTQIFRVTIY